MASMIAVPVPRLSRQPWRLSCSYGQLTANSLPRSSHSLSALLAFPPHTSSVIPQRVASARLAPPLVGDAGGNVVGVGDMLSAGRVSPSESLQRRLCDPNRGSEAVVLPRFEKALRPYPSPCSNLAGTGATVPPSVVSRSIARLPVNHPSSIEGTSGRCR